MKKTSGAKARKDSAGAPVSLEPPLSKTKNLFPIVGIGASAGGLEALEVFLTHLPGDCGAAFVIVQHLDPTYKGIMVELLQRKTAMPVVEVRDRLHVASNHVYMIPPNTDMSILHGVLHLLEPSAPRGLRLPIDYFFRSLALDCQSRSIGVILSGMGSDGTLGLRVIKEEGGAVFVQAPDSAKFDSMPRSAIAAGLADVVAPVDELAGRVAAYLNYAPLDAKVEPVRDRAVQSSLEKITILVRTQTGHDFSMYKKSTFYRRIERRMSLHQLDKITDYVRYLQNNPQEIELLFKEMLIGVTSFFRDPPAWEQLKAEVIPTLLAANPKGGVLRAWVCGCSSGEEAYSLVMLFREALDQVKPAGKFKIQVFATDLDRDGIDKARTGTFLANIAAEVSAERLRRFFFKQDPGYRMLKEIREMVIFAHHNVIIDPPFTKMDILVCRNLMIYLEQKAQKKLLPLFHYSLKPGGILFLGSAETIGTFTNLFVPIAGNNHIYRRIDAPLWKEPVEFPTAFLPHAAVAETAPALVRGTNPNLQSLAEQYLLRHHCPAAVLTNEKGDILYVNGRTGKYLEPAAGKANWNIFAMAREGLRYLLNSAWREALQKKTATGLNRLQVRSNGNTHTVDITVEQISGQVVLQGMVLITFREAETPSEIKSVDKAHRVTDREALERELEQARKEVDLCREEMQTSQEELKSTNEEFQSTNEELQSTNEELTTSREEMQSLNEELQTINHELQIKVNELSQSNNDMKNLLNSTDIATLFLDDALTVRRFTDRTTSIIKLIPGDSGRPITDITSDLDYPKMAADAKEVLRSLVFIEKEVATSDGRWFQVRVMPYRTMENRIDGVVITFTNITVAKTLEARLRQALAGAEKKVKVKGHA